MILLSARLHPLKVLITGVAGIAAVRADVPLVEKRLMATTLLLLSDTKRIGIGLKQRKGMNYGTKKQAPRGAVWA